MPLRNLAHPARVDLPYQRRLPMKGIVAYFLGIPVVVIILFYVLDIF